MDTKPTVAFIKMFCVLCSFDKKGRSSGMPDELTSEQRGEPAAVWRPARGSQAHLCTMSSSPMKLILI